VLEEFYPTSAWPLSLIRSSYWTAHHIIIEAKPCINRRVHSYMPSWRVVFASLLYSLLAKNSSALDSRSLSTTSVLNPEASRLSISIEHQTN